MSGHRNIVIVTAAGISAESGLATFRGSNELWEGHHIDDESACHMSAFDPLKTFTWPAYQAAEATMGAMMIPFVIAAQMAVLGSGSMAAEPVGRTASSEQNVPALSSFSWISSDSHQSATAYYRCRRRGVGGLFPADGEAELEAARNSVRLMIYTQKARCRSERARLLAALDADLRRHNARTSNATTPIGYAEWALDVFEQDVNDRILEGFALF